MANTEDRKTTSADAAPEGACGPLERGEIPVTFDRKLGKTMPLEWAEQVLCEMYEDEQLRPSLAVIFARVSMGVNVRKPIQRRPARP